MNLKSKGNKTFLLKWGMSTKFFKKFYLKTNSDLDKTEEQKISLLFHRLGRMSIK